MMVTDILVCWLPTLQSHYIFMLTGLQSYASFYTMPFLTEFFQSFLRTTLNPKTWIQICVRSWLEEEVISFRPDLELDLEQLLEMGLNLEIILKMGLSLVIILRIDIFSNYMAHLLQIKGKQKIVQLVSNQFIGIYFWLSILF